MESEPHNQLVGSIDGRLEIESLCDRFEKELSDGQNVSIAEFLDTTSLTPELQPYLVYELVRLTLDYGRPDLPQNFLVHQEHHHTAEVARACRHFGNPELTTLVYSGAKKIHIDGFPITDRFRCIRHLGSGGMGHVYEVWDLERHMPMALKTLHSLSGRTLDQFKQEFRSLASIDHGNLVRLYEFFQSDQHWFFTMELIDGVDLLSYCHHEGGVDLTRAQSCFKQLAIGLSHLHGSEKLHRDIKPSNLLVTADGTLKILDFGLVLELSENPTQTRIATPAIVGTPSYMSPEQMMSHPLTTASDWFAVGVVLHELLTKRKPSQKENPLTNGNLPEHLLELSRKLMSTSPADRPDKDSIFEALDLETKIDTSSPIVPEIFAGREDLLKKLSQLSPHPDQSQPTIAILSGRSGEGKTALAHHYLGTLNQDNDTIILASRCYDHESVQYPGIDGLTDELAQHLSAIPEDELAKFVPKDISLLIRVFPGLSKVRWPSSDENSAAEPDSQDPKILRERALSSLRELLTKVAENRALVLFVDDFQWAGNDSTEFLALLVKAPPPCLIFLACRAEHPHLETILETVAVSPVTAAAPNTIVEHFELTPFTQKEAQKLSYLICKQRQLNSLSEDDFLKVYQESHGHAYLLTELLWNYQTGITPLSDKDSLSEVLRSKIHSLSEDARKLLDFIALSIIPLQTRSVYNLAGLTEYDPILIRHLSNEKLISFSQVGMEASLRPYHDAVRAAVDSTMKASAKKQRHHDLAHWLEIESKVINPQVVAFHLEEAEELEKSSSYYLKAAEQAMQSLAFELASTLFRKALKLNPKLKTLEVQEIREDLAVALESSDRSYEAAVEFHAVGLEKQGSEKLYNLRHAALLYCSSGRLDQGLVLLKDLLKQNGFQVNHHQSLFGNIRWFIHQGLLALKLRKHPELDQSNPSLAKKADLFLYGAAGLSLVDPFASAHLLLKSVHLAFKGGDYETLGKALALNAIYHSSSNHHLARCAESSDTIIRKLCTSSDDPYLTGYYLMAKGLTVEHRNKFPEAYSILKEAEEILVKQCYRVWWEIATVRTCLMWNLCYLGKFSELEPRIHRYLEEANERNDLFLKSNISTYPYPLVLLSRDEPEEAGRVADSGMEGWSKNPGFHVQHQTYLMGRALVFLYADDPIGATEFYEKNWPEFSSAGIFLFDFVEGWALDIRITTAVAAAAVTHGAAKKAHLRVARKSMNRLKKVQLILTSSLVLRFEGVLAYLQNDSDAAQTHLREAILGFQKHGLASHALSAEHLLCEISGDAPSDQLLEGFRACGIKNPARWRKSQMGI